MSYRAVFLKETQLRVRNARVAGREVRETTCRIEPSFFVSVSSTYDVRLASVALLIAAISRRNN